MESLSMHFVPPTRRQFLQGLAALSGSVLLSPRGTAAAATPGKPHVSCNVWGWSVFYRRDKRDFGKSLDEGLADAARSGLDGMEMSASDPTQIDELAPLLKKHGLEMRSLYMGSTLHEPEQAEKSIAAIVAVAQKAQPLGTRIIVTNPSPLRGRENADKTDAQLTAQAAALDDLGGRLKALGVVLAYHNHSVELRNAAREFHHMMLATDPGKVSLCLDCHWVYRGSGNSSVALFDVLKLYGPRVVELHLRQSVDNVWSESFGDGDIDYRAVAKHLAAINIKPHLVLEQGPEAATPKTLDPVEIHRRSRQYVDRVFS
jgi:inosose dehydratase